MSQIPLVDPNDEVVVKDLDGSWKVYRSGRLTDNTPSRPTPPALVQPVSAVSAPVSSPPLPTSPSLEPVMRTPAAESPAAGSKRSMHDIVPPHTLVGPVDELRMTIADYEQLGATAKERAGRIRSKIAQLEGDEYAKHLEGIAAWKGSDVYHLYILLGQESVLSSTSVEETIERRKNAGEPILSSDDFHAINELNHELRN